jgi:hypothetical protein
MEATACECTPAVQRGNQGLERPARTAYGRPSAKSAQSFYGVAAIDARAQ